MENISKRLWPRRIYVKVKETHPVLGSIFFTVWSILWIVLTIFLNIVLVVIVLATILLLLYSLLSDPSFDPIPNLNFTSSKKKEKDRMY